MKRILLFGLAATLIWAAGCSDSDGNDPLDVVVPTLEAPNPIQLPEYTSGTSVTIEWTAEKSGTDREFLAQRSLTADFSSQVESSSWTSTASVVFQNLQDGVVHYFRVMAREPGSDDSAFSDPVFTETDASPPQSSLEETVEEQTSLRFELPFQSEDAGSGVAETELWFSREGAPFELAGSFAGSPALFVATESGRYEFKTISRDRVGNIEAKPAAERDTEVPEPIILVDRDNKEWDITNAALRYGMIASRWGHGIGQHTIQPVIDPRMIERGEPGFPGDEELFFVLAVEIDGVAHSYRMGDLPNREVVDDEIAGTPIAATY